MHPLASFGFAILGAAGLLAACAARRPALIANAAVEPVSVTPSPAAPVAWAEPPRAVSTASSERATDVSTASAEPAVEPVCPSGMVLVEGDYCTRVREDCVTWADPPGRPFARCAKFAPSVCQGLRVHKRFCMDQDEYVRAGESLPLGNVSWTEARALCGEGGKRLCAETEWEFACEGEQMLPYPTGYERDPKACNFDKGNLVDPATGRLRDQRAPPAQLGHCTSPFGARSMSGNVDEWVLRDRTNGAWRSALKGGWWMPARDRCRPATTSHDEHFQGLQTGMRCCADAP